MILDEILKDINRVISAARGTGYLKDDIDYLSRQVEHLEELEKLYEMPFSIENLNKVSDCKSKAVRTINIMLETIKRIQENIKNRKDKLTVESGTTTSDRKIVEEGESDLFLSEDGKQLIRSRRCMPNLLMIPEKDTDGRLVTKKYYKIAKDQDVPENLVEKAKLLENIIDVD